MKRVLKALQNHEHEQEMVDNENIVFERCLPLRRHHSARAVGRLRTRWEILKFRVLGSERYFTHWAKHTRRRPSCAPDSDLVEALDDVLAADARYRMAKINSGDVAASRKAFRDRCNASLPEDGRKI